MSERYFITGVQLGLLQSLNETERKKIVDEIIDKQFICNCYSDNDKEKFKEKIKEVIKW
jgi:hypothetical protein